jgi:hypothetical protein
MAWFRVQQVSDPLRRRILLVDGKEGNGRTCNGRREAALPEGANGSDRVQGPSTDLASSARAASHHALTPRPCLTREPRHGCTR